MNRSMELENSALGRQSQPRRDRKLEYRRRQIQRAEPPSAGSRSPKSEQPAKSAMPGASPLPSPLFEPGTSGSDQHHASPRSSKYYDIEHTVSLPPLRITLLSIESLLTRHTTTSNVTTAKPELLPISLIVYPTSVLILYFGRRANSLSLGRKYTWPYDMVAGL